LSRLLKKQKRKILSLLNLLERSLTPRTLKRRRERVLVTTLIKVLNGM
jgi:hypothetical protein